ncbi:hypothetical protein AB0I72_11905 [Nocardiopsis sp. NPDC049922]|uniref:hypothetical protein n=1 Tax=Nocardiopsis sp. NPDC049922 TaxID=3155157 RepID=UPI0033E9DD50
MPGHEVGVNAHDAHGAGSNAEAYAAGFVGLGADFNETLLAAKAACDHDPKVTGWGGYGEGQASAIARVENHGLSLSENIQGGASEAAFTDQDSGVEFTAIDVPLSRDPNISFH